MTLGIEVTGLRVDYGDFNALHDLSFELSGGKIHGLLGRNGSGKSTLLSVIAAFRKASGGQVRVGGQDPFENPEIVRQICFIRESGDTEGHSVKSALRFAADFRPEWDSDYASALLDRFEIPLKKSVGELSRGKKSALGVTLGLASRAPLTIFDESYLGMDAPSRYAFYEEVLNDYLEHPRTVILSTHLIEEVGSLFEEVVIIDRGSLILQEESDNLRERGATVTGPAEVVDRFTESLDVLNEQRLGGTKAVTVYGTLTSAQREQAAADRLELGPVGIQDLFVHLTGTTSKAEQGGGKR
ncbi:ATP-binding cassette domain-containing protein [Actinoalloteichus hymeniacidonis]|uniref:ABC-type multidrug transport system, ATPase component n=1 Tax=Actinoalloteichus hymeniacidonis TaxID=340345 RepID=A0AAC9N000_9PSEU|nr:ABC transporter ATP-binding protein [Actinoalloteichus hymeniacidonis]AOS65054.1 ABC-type multidrug transport system, ATPase component [Actinoalloteichus hymeniacidonis]MBB5906867.1 ABC-2 type transport system ATP-binding protein [Actinoalloteichus hymeniacidonis]